MRSNYAEFRRLSAARPALLRRESQSGSGHHPDALCGGSKFRCCLDCGVQSWFTSNIRHLPAEARQNYIWDKVIYSNPIKDRSTLEELDQYKPLVAFDNREEIRRFGSMRRMPD